MEPSDHPFVISGASLEIPSPATPNPNERHDRTDRRNSNENNNQTANHLHVLTENVNIRRPITPVEEFFLNGGNPVRPKTPADEFFRNGGANPARNVDMSEDLTIGDAILGPKFRNFFSDVSVVGLKYVALAGVSWLRRLIWLLLVLLGLGFMIFQVNDRINHYMTWPTTVDVRINYNHSLKFPTVTICNENTVMKTMAQYNGLVELVHDMMPPYPWPEYSPNFTLYGPYFQSMKENNTDWYEIYESYSHPISDVRIPPSEVFPEGRLVWGSLIDCTYNTKRCRAKDFDIVPTNMGFCFQFNGVGFERYTSRPGSLYGLQMLLYVGQSEYLASHSKSAGFRVLLHDPLETPLMLEQGFKVNPGYVNLVAFHLENVTLLEAPYGDCEQNNTYRYSTCAQQCLAEHVVEQCQCQEFYFNHPSAPVCDLMERWQCVNGAVQQFSDDSKEQQCGCRRECHEKNYKYTVSAAQASDHVIDFMAKTEFAHMPFDLVRNTVQNDFAVLEIFYSDLSYEEITVQPAYTILSLLCDVGGAMGLVLGSTILTLVEFLDFLVCLVGSAVQFHVAKKTDRRMRGQARRQEGEREGESGREGVRERTRDSSTQRRNKRKERKNEQTRQAFI